MNVLSTFNGMGCIWLALDKLGIAVEKRYSCEIDKYANIVNDANYPDTIQLGDVTKVKGSELEDVGLLVGGSPCQGFSFAGKQLNFEDPRSKLFFEFVRLKEESKAKYFLLENVKMKKEYQDVISSYLGVEPIEINSSLVSAQNRKRLYWTNIPGVELPKEKYIYLKDILSSNCNHTYIKDTSYGKIKTILTDKNRLELLEENYKNNGELLEKCKLVCQIINDTPSKISRQGDRVYSILGKTPCLTTNQSYIIDDGSSNKNNWRRLSILEWERLQTVPESYTKGVSIAQRKRMIGNGWTVDVIAHILKGLEPLY